MESRRIMFRFFCIFVISFFLSECSIPEKGTGVNKKLRITAVGDIMAHSTQIDTAYDKSCKCYKFDEVFVNISDQLKDSDLRIANFETTLPGLDKEYTGYPLFGAPDSLAEAVKKAGFDIVTTSNNHCMDKGKKGLRRTIDRLAELGFHQTGTFKDKSDYETRRIQLLEKNGFTFVLLAYTYSTNGIAIPADVHVNLIDKDLISEDISLAKDLNPDFIMVYYHFGLEYQRLPSDEQRDLVQFTFHEGADIVLGGHPHVLQPYEKKWYRDKYGILKERLVIYSLGNFISSQRYPYTYGGIFFSFSLEKKEIGIQISEIDYETVTVYRDIGKGIYQFYLIPYTFSHDLGNKPRMTEEGKKAMMNFHEETRILFNKYSYIQD